MIKVVSNKEQTATGPLPITFNSDGTPLDDYILYGTAEGAGVETESGEPTGYKLPMTVESGEESTATPIYIGDSKLGEEEYVDFGEQKVYKRTENLFDSKSKYREFGGGSALSFINGVSVSSGEQYWHNATNMLYVRVSFYLDNDRISTTSWRLNPTVVTVPNNCNAMYVEVRNLQYDKITPEQLGTVDSIMLVKGSTAPDHYIPYGVEPADPPVALPELSTYQGENTLSCSEGLGEVSQITFVGPVEETITKIMRTEDDGQGNVTEHVLYKEGS